MYGIELCSIEFFMSLGSQQYVTFTLFIDTCTGRERKGESVMEKSARAKTEQNREKSVICFF